jgi:hypothetical protein
MNSRDASVIAVARKNPAIKIRSKEDIIRHI